MKDSWITFWGIVLMIISIWIMSLIGSWAEQRRYDRIPDYPVKVFEP
jgi:hypothetical protein